MRVTKADIMFGLQRLLEVYPRAKHLPDDPAKLTEIYHRELDDLDVEIFRTAVSAYCKSDARYFPKPGELRALGQRVHRADLGADKLTAQERWEREWPEAPLNRPLPCPTCGAVDGASVDAPIPTKRRFVPHDAAKHQAAGVGFVGLSSEQLTKVPA